MMRTFADRRAFEMSEIYRGRFFAVIRERKGVNRFPAVEEVMDETGTPVPPESIIKIYLDGKEMPYEPKKIK